jgi:hypothetical protein
MSSRIIIAGDTHFGSKFAPRANADNPLQSELWDAWTDMVDEVGRVDIVIANGDLCEGADPKSNGLGCWTTDLNEQVKGAAAMFKMIRCDRNHFYGTQGSTYHSGTNPSLDNMVLDTIGGEFGPYIALVLDGNRFFFNHNGGAARKQGNRAGNLYRHIIASMLNAPAFGDYRFLAFNHGHYFCEVHANDHIAVNTPGWKGIDTFIGTRGVPDAPDIGYVVVDVKGSEIEMTHATRTQSREYVLKEYVV